MIEKAKPFICKYNGKLNNSYGRIPVDENGTVEIYIRWCSK